MASIEITDPPSTDGATQTRSVGVRFTTPDYDTSAVSITLRVDATQSGTFRDLSEESVGRYNGVETDSRTFSTFIGVQAPYDLRAVASFSGAGDNQGDETTATATVSVGGQRSTPSVEDVGADGDIDTSDSTVEVRGGDAGQVTPRVGPVEPITMSASYQLPFDRDNNQTACGETIQNSNGDLDWRIVFEGILTLGQVDRLRQLRGQDTVETRSPVFGVREVAFDQLQLDRSDEVGEIEVNGQVQPAYEFQLQTKELSEDAGGLFGG